MIRICFTNITQRDISILYTTTFRPLLEYASVVWSSWYKTDIDLLENVQKRSLALCNKLSVLEAFRFRIRIRMFTGDMSNYIHSPGPVIWEISP